MNQSVRPLLFRSISKLLFGPIGQLVFVSIEFVSF